MKKEPKRIPLVRETVFVLSLQSARGGGLEPSITTSTEVPTVSNECIPTLEQAV